VELASAFDEEPRMPPESDDEEIDSLEDLILVLEDLAEAYPYIDPDVEFIILEESSKPILIVSPTAFKTMERKAVGK